MPAGYRASQRLAYYPTKLAYLDANAGGKKRIGAYLSASYSILDRLTVGLTLRGSTPVGKPKTAGFRGPEFEDYTECPFAGDEPDCAGVPPVTVEDPGYGSLRLHVEVPFKKYLQSFAIYEVFSSSLDNEGLDLLTFDGDNEVFFSGVRLQLLPIVFIQAQLRRFYFLQRVTNVDLVAKTFEQDGNYHSEWTFAFHLYAGYEF
jgi:hypothetical protein